LPHLRHVLSDQLQQWLTAVDAMSVAPGRSELIATALDVVPDLVASELTTLSVCDLDRGTRTVHGRNGEQLSEDDRALFDRHFREHPLVRFHAAHPGGPTQRISDCPEASTFADSAIYSDYYRRIGIRYVMALPLRIDQHSIISIVLNRSGSDFRDRERALLDAIRGPLAALYQGAVSREEARLGFASLCALVRESGWQVLRLDAEGTLTEGTTVSEQLLAKYFPDFRATPRPKLPGALTSWLRAARNWGLDQAVRTPPQPYTKRLARGELTARFVANAGEPGSGFLLVRETVAALAPDSLSELPITPRQREILCLVDRGKTNAEIGLILSISPRTVQKHLENAFEKLGVETRWAAAARIRTAAGG